jgi:transposase|nr:MAG TPA: transposase [Caudoviricetes sp.]
MNFQIDPTVKTNNICGKIKDARSFFVRMVLKRYNEGLSIKQLSEEFGVCEGTIYVSLNQAEKETGIKRQERANTKVRMNQDQLDMAAYLLNHGWSIQQTAKKVGVNYAAIQNRTKTGSLPQSRNSSTIFKSKELAIKKLEERISRMERMAKNGLF